MWRRLQDLPLFLQFVWIMAISMLVPAFFGLAQQDFHVSRTFLYGSILTLIISTLVAIASAPTEDTPPLRLQSYLLSLFAAFTVLPLILAVPFAEALQNTTLVNAYLEMVSALTTTGLILFDDPERLSPALHLWRAQVAWMGGMMMWIAAVAVFAPLSLGGFEVTAQQGFAQTSEGNSGFGHLDPARRWRRSSQALIPIYTGLTLVLWVLLMILGEESSVALMHAMSVLSTSGISPVGGLSNGDAGWAGEILVFLFLLFALSRQTFSTDLGAVRNEGLHKDPEFRFGLFIVVVAPLLLFMRHWVGAFEVSEEENLLAALRALWGSFFTVLSFLTTAGFESGYWSAAQNWSGLGTPGLILMGLALVGGGVATTAGGVKLLRVYALYLQGLREMDRMVHPSAVSGVTGRDRRIRRKGAVIAWVVFMLFALSLAAVTLLLAAFGTPVQEAIVLTTATLSNTGPLVVAATETPIEVLSLNFWAKLVLCASMVLGRMETLAIIALLSLDQWRN